jgi:hypothetical protein
MALLLSSAEVLVLLTVRGSHQWLPVRDGNVNGESVARGGNDASVARAPSRLPAHRGRHASIIGKRNRLADDADGNAENAPLSAVAT